MNRLLSYRFAVVLGVAAAFLVLVSLASAEEATTRPAYPKLPAEGIFRRVSPAVVQILTFDAEGQAIGRGSGFIVDPNGLVVTNRHVIEGAAKATIVLADKRSLPVVGVASLLAQHDLALLKVNGRNLPVLRIAESAPEVGAKVFAIGNPRGFTNTISSGIVSAHRERAGKLLLLQTTAPISPGSSGGPLVGETGRAIGVTTGSVTTGQNLNFAVPCNRIVELLRRPRNILPLPIRPLARRKPVLAAKRKEPERVFRSLLGVLDEVPKDKFPRRQGKRDTRELSCRVASQYLRQHVQGSRIVLSGMALERAWLRDSEVAVSLHAKVPTRGCTVSIDCSLARPTTPRNVPLAKRLLETKRGTLLSIDGVVEWIYMQYTWGGRLQFDMTIRLVDWHIPAREYEETEGVEEEPNAARPSASQPSVKSTPASRAQAKLRLANSYLKAGLRESAIRTLESLQRLYPDTAAAEEARRRLARLKSR